MAASIMTLHYYDKAAGRRFDDERDYKPNEAVAFVRELRNPDACMITLAVRQISKGE